MALKPYCRPNHEHVVVGVSFTLIKPCGSLFRSRGVNISFDRSSLKVTTPKRVGFRIHNVHVVNYVYFIRMLFLYEPARPQWSCGRQRQELGGHETARRILFVGHKAFNLLFVLVVSSSRISSWGTRTAGPQSGPRLIGRHFFDNVRGLDPVPASHESRPEL